MLRFAIWFVTEGWKEYKKQDVARKECDEAQRKMFEEFINSTHVGKPSLKPSQEEMEKALKNLNSNQAIITDLDRMDYGYTIAVIAWNEAIEAAAVRMIEIEESEDSYSAEEIRKLKK